MALAKSLRRVRITGTGMYVPPEVYTNKDLEKMMDTSDEWIQQRSGIKERRFAKEGVGASDLAVPAAKAALDMAGLKPTDIDMVIFASLTPDYYFPGPGVFLQDKLGMGTTPALDVRNQCSGFIYGLSCGHLFVASGQYDRVLLIGAETHSRALDFTTRGRDVAVLFGDGAGAVVLEASKDPECGILTTHLHSEGAHRDHLKVQFPSNLQWPYIKPENLEDGGVFPKMDGKLVFKHAVSRMPEVIDEALTANHLTPDDISLFVFHQANIRITEAAMKSLGQPMEKSFNNIDRYGNCSAASIPMCLAEAERAGRLKKKDLVCMASFGAGFTWASAVIRW
jgi:3-oxoacyl-[acyl-carrier-protein] synthase-3